jgi:hypothetical protein
MNIKTFRLDQVLEYDEYERRVTFDCRSVLTKILVVLYPAHIEGAFTEDLTLHVDSVFSDKSVSSQAAGDTACARSLSVSLGVCAKKLIGFACLGHYENKSVTKKDNA